MVGASEYRKTDPNRAGRGAGYYYHRGNGVFSKRSDKLDKARTCSTRITKKSRGAYGHTGDSAKWL